MTSTPPSGSQPRTPDALGEVANLIDGGDMDCGSGLLLLITRAMRRLSDGDRLGIRSAEASVLTDLPIWAELVGHTVAAEVAETPTGPWWFSVSKGAPAESATVFSQGSRTPVGPPSVGLHQLQLQSLVHYCCAESSPKAPARQLPVRDSRSGFRGVRRLGGREVYLTGGEPFMHPDSGRWWRPQPGSSGRS